MSMVAIRSLKKKGAGHLRTLHYLRGFGHLLSLREPMSYFDDFYQAKLVSGIFNI